MGCPFLGDVDSFERKQGSYMNASNELQKTKDKLQQLQVCSTHTNETYYSPFAGVQKGTVDALPPPKKKKIIIIKE